MNFYLRCGRLSVLNWVDMLQAAAYAMNLRPHPQSRDRKRQVQSAGELMNGRKSDLSKMIASLGEIVIADEGGAKASAGATTGNHCIFLHSVEGGFLVRSYRTKKLFTTRAVRRLNGPRGNIEGAILLRLAIQVGNGVRWGRDRGSIGRGCD